MSLQYVRQEAVVEAWRLDRGAKNLEEIVAQVAPKVPEWKLRRADSFREPGQQVLLCEKLSEERQTSYIRFAVAPGDWLVLEKESKRLARWPHILFRYAHVQTELPEEWPIGDDDLGNRR